VDPKGGFGVTFLVLDYFPLLFGNVFKSPNWNFITTSWSRTHPRFYTGVDAAVDSALYRNIRLCGGDGSVARWYHLHVGDVVVV